MHDRNDTTEATPPPTPDDVRTFRRHGDWALLAALANEVGVFGALADGDASASELAERLGLSARGLDAVLGALEAIGAVRLEPGDRWRLTGSARAHWVDRDTPDYEGGALAQWLEQVRTWTAELPEAIRRGGPPPTGDGPERGAPSDPQALARFMAAMENKDPALVSAVVEGCLDRGPAARRMLDLGGGPGTFARAFIERGLEATLFDRPDVIEHVREAYGLDRVARLELRAGDFLADPPEGEWDVVLLANITHIYSAETNAGLLRALGPRIAPGGVLAILDMVRGPSRFAALFALQMLLHTQEGGTYDPGVYRSWLADAGLEDVRMRSLTEDVQLVTGLRPGSHAV